jgi:hypothetical protein
MITTIRQDSPDRIEKLDILYNELKGSLNFFLDFTNLNLQSPGYGLTVDSTQKTRVASIAAVGFSLTAWVIGAARGYIPHEKGLEITRGTLRTLLECASHHRGFFAHFLSMDSAQRYRKCEYSTIDTALCLNGVITAAAYFQDEQLTELAEKLLQRVDWNFLVFEKGGKTLFRMAYNPDKGGDYVTGAPGFIHQWDMAAEQKMMYLQAAPYLEPCMARQLYGGFARDTGYFDGKPIIINPAGNLFCYQFAEAWLDTQKYLDPDGIDWFNNSRLACLANRSWCIENSDQFRTYHANSWGASAGDSPWGYDVSGSTPSLFKPTPNGVVSICGGISSLPFIPEQAISMIDYLYENHPLTWGKYGFFDSYNLDFNPPWYSNTIYGINKGCSMIMIENFFSRLIWETYTNSPIIQKGLEILGFHKKEGETHG